MTELVEIISRSAEILKVPLDEAGALEIARRSRGTPRVANRLLRRVRDFAQIKGDGLITLEIANMALDLLDIDQEGLDKTDRLMLGDHHSQIRRRPSGFGSFGGDHQ